MVKTNRKIYPIKINFNGINLDDLRTKFKEENMVDNILNIDGKKVSLCFKEARGGVLFFSLCKWDNTDVTVTNFETKKDERSYLGSKRRVKQHSLFAIISEYNVMLVLFNYDAFWHVVPTLNKYLEEKLNKQFLTEFIQQEYSQKDIKNLCKTSKGMTFIYRHARKIPINDDSSGDSATKMRKYTEKREDAIKIFYMKNMTWSQKIEILMGLKDKKVWDKIVIDTSTIGKIDILDNFILNFDCDIHTDKDKLALLEEFIEKVMEFKEKYKATFLSYQLPSLEIK